MNKEIEILKWSNPAQVKQNANKYFSNDVPIYLSNRKDKKYMLQNPDGKWIHFGQIGFKDGTLDDEDREKRIKRFKSRNARWANSPKWAASSLAFHLLW
jgi:hypothetical protein